MTAEREWKDAVESHTTTSLDDRKAQYAAWRDRLRNHGHDDEIDLDAPDPAKAKWSVEGLFADSWLDESEGATDAATEADPHTLSN